MDEVVRLARRYERERRARKAAEALIEEKSLALYRANQQLEEFNRDLEFRIAEATSDLRHSNLQLEQRVSELAALNSVARSLSSVIEIDALLTKIIELSQDVMQADAASLLLRDESTDKLHFHVATGRGAREITKHSVETGQGIAGYVAQTGKPELVPDAYADSRFDPSFDQLTGVRTKSLIAVPIQAKDRIIGVVEVINRADGTLFGESDLRLFESFAGNAAVAIENARLFEKTVLMAAELREALEKERWLTIERDKLGAYIPKTVRDEISRNREQKLALGGKLLTVTILFSDIKGFTTISESMQPQELVTFLNEYMTAMTAEVEHNGGVVDKFIGDGIMAVFTDDHDEAVHARNAVCAGIAMQKRLRTLREVWKANRPDIASLEMRVGVNTGEVVAGNIGSETRMDYTVMGDNVNVASRIESHCTPGHVYLSHATWQHVRGAFETDRIDPIQVKNRIQPVQVYSIRAE